MTDFGTPALSFSSRVSSDMLLVFIQLQCHPPYQLDSSTFNCDLGLIKLMLITKNLA